jgi:hypothetical protein
LVAGFVVAFFFAGAAFFADLAAFVAAGFLVAFFFAGAAFFADAAARVGAALFAAAVFVAAGFLAAAFFAAAFVAGASPEAALDPRRPTTRRATEPARPASDLLPVFAICCPLGSPRSEHLCARRRRGAVLKQA